MLRLNMLLASKPQSGVHSLLSLLLVLLAHVASADSSTATNNTSVSLAVSHFNEVNFQLLRLDASGTLFFSQAVNSTWQAVPDTIALTVQPKPNSPIGLVSWAPSGVTGDTSIRAYYLDTTDKIIELVGICASFACKWKNDNGLVGVSASPSSGLTAAVVPGAGSQWGINVFYAGADSRLSVASYTKGTLWMNGTAIGPKVAPGSSIAVSASADQANFQVYFHAADTRALSQISFNNATSTWSSATPLLPPTTSAPETPLPSLAAIHIPIRPSRRLYFINATRHLEALASADDGLTWAPIDQTAERIPRADAPGDALAAVSWATKVRLFFTIDAAVTEMSMKGSGQFYVVQPAAARVGGNGDDAEETDGAETTTPPGGGTADKGTGADGNDKKTAGGLTVPELVGIVLGSVSTFFTVAAVIWKWKWLQSAWRKCRGDPEQEEPLVVKNV